MSPIRLIILAVAAGAAIVAALLVRGMAGNGSPEIVERRVEVQVAAQKVLTTNRDLVVGEILTPEDLQWIDWPEKGLNISFFMQEQTPDAISTISGSVVRTPFYQNEPILPQKIVQKGDTGYMAALLNPGMRAISVEISAESASGGFILPNDRVDVIMNYNEESAEENGETRIVTVTVLENVRVLAIDQKFRETDTGESAVGRVATLELSPEDAELVTLVSNKGQLTLALRSLGDRLEAGDSVVSKRELFETGAAGVPEGQVVIFRRGDASVTQVEGTGS